MERERALLFLVHLSAGEPHPEGLKTEAIIAWRLTQSQPKVQIKPTQLQTLNTDRQGERDLCLVVVVLAEE